VGQVSSDRTHFKPNIKENYLLSLRRATGRDGGGQGGAGLL
jgi:hypothetical protein